MSPEPRPVAWVVGAGGLVGRHVAGELRRTGYEVMTRTVPWTDEQAAVDALVRGAADLRRLAAGRPWALAWCAGAGVVATGEQELSAELRVFAQVLGLLETRLPDASAGVVFLASSAGGVYAGSSGPPFTELSEPVALVPYGRTKLAMERAVERLGRRAGVRVVVGRLANVYGPGQRLGKPQGLLSQLCLADATQRPLPVYVSLDTIRDYLYVVDLARMVVRCLRLARAEPPGAVVTKVLASGRPVTVGHLVAEARRVFHRPLRTMDVPGGAGQVLDLRLASTRWPEVDTDARTPLAAGLAATAADVRARVVRGAALDG
ncbi:NAD(P)-dependent oxidoreductase [Phycicoccus sp. CSK15P-2]|uniref:NAD-dependent epimerase/dehydratase family protein n=1 Tax=Phycicoccus sp. CSK15P-2 TaxID=2807627 RepID=UPI0019519477|nr:NAD(P)-dependent oxidoreductase [Phycicoccus sp. CSK15P-2]MBM6404276.1 NAD(P)-dependent oxidoreductase [Phycicoccus sp. CSK15P-2]